MTQDEIDNIKYGEPMTTHDRDKVIAAAIKSGLGEAFWLSPQHPDFEEEMGMLERFYATAFEVGKIAGVREYTTAKLAAQGITCYGGDN